MYWNYNALQSTRENYLSTGVSGASAVIALRHNTQNNIRRGLRAAIPKLFYRACRLTPSSHEEKKNTGSIQTRSYYVHGNRGGPVRGLQVATQRSSR